MGYPHKKGSAHPKAIFTEEQVREIREAYKEPGTTYAHLAEKYKAKIPTIGHIIRRTTWKHVE